MTFFDLLACLALWMTARTLPAINDPDAFCRSPLSSDAAIVAFYADNPDWLTDRLEGAAALAKACPDAPIFLVGGSRPRRGYFGSLDMAERLTVMGVATGRMKTETRSRSTRANVEEAVAMAEAAGKTKLVAVTDRPQGLRIRRAARHIAPELLVDFHVTGRQSDPLGAIMRGNYELAAWAMEFAPEAFREALFSLLGRR
ncbi:MAG: YdcF family protein [Phyllobacteriaceae bacterium]|nr:YdcF family protein [Phyllobacteriaceae bacterium]